MRTRPKIERTPVMEPRMQFTTIHQTAIAGLLALAVLCAPPVARAEESFAGKTVTIDVPVAPGGGYDAYARLVARHIRKHLPGQPTVIVKNMPGAGGIILAGHLYTQAPKDG